MMKRFWPVVMAGILLTAAAAAQVDTKNWTRFSTKDGSLSLMLPQGWGMADANDPKLKETMAKLTKENPKLVAMMKQNEGNSDIQLMSYDFSDGNLEDGMDNMNVIVKANPGITEKDYNDVGKEVLGQIPFTGKSEMKIVNLPVGKTLTYWGTMELSMDGSKLSMDILGAFFVKGDKMYIITLTVGKDGLKNQREKLDQILKTIKVS
ncbi:MAG: hypothetical protein KF784_14335 [Fimbriimonadaceae bacterium]|nr:hypothetical protein [Fimbriimonadaceae bacterium]